MPASELDHARYAAELGRIIDRAARLDAGTLRALFDPLNEARKEVARLLAAGQTDWGIAHYSTLQARIERAIEELTGELGTQLKRAMGARWRDAANGIDDLLERFGGEAERLGVRLDTRALTVQSAFAPSLVQDVTDETIRALGAKLRLGMMSGRNGLDVIKELSAALVDSDGNPLPGVWGSTLRRAEVIFRTELGRIASLAEQARMNQHEEEMPGLLKIWVHSGLEDGNERPSHVRAGKDYDEGGDPGPIPVGEMFILHPTAEERKRDPLRRSTLKAMYPRDGGLPACQSVNCACITAPYRASWSDGPALRESARRSFAWMAEARALRAASGRGRAFAVGVAEALRRKAA